MKAGIRVWGRIILLGAAILLSLHLILLFGLTTLLQQKILPDVYAKTGIEIQISRASLNLPRGVLTLSDLRIMNPEGFLLEHAFSVDRIRLHVDLRSLFGKGVIEIGEVDVRDARLNVIRNEEGDINLLLLTADDTVAVAPSAPSYPEERPVEQIPAPSREPLPEPAARALPEIRLRQLACDASIRYLDLAFRDVDFVLNLSLSGTGLSTVQDPAEPWSDLALIGSLGTDNTRFVTDVQLRLAPLIDPENPSFDLQGRMLEMDPKILRKAYSKLGLRSDPFGLEPELYCRDAQFQNSRVTIQVNHIELEEKLSARLGGMGTIESLRVALPIEGSLYEPRVDLDGAMQSALANNARSVFEALLLGAAAGEGNTHAPPENLTDAAVDLLGQHVDEVGESEALQQALKNLAGDPSDPSNQNNTVSSDLVIDLLGEHVEEIGEDDELKEGLKDLGRRLFGK